MKRQITSSRLNVNAGIMDWYVKALEKLAKQMTKECRENDGNFNPLFLMLLVNLVLQAA